MAAKQKALKVESWPIDKFVFYASNPRKNDHAVDNIAAAIREFGFRIPVIAKSDGTVVDGHLRLKAAKKLGLAEVPVILADDLTDAQIKAFRISVNKMADLADWDMELLALEFSDLSALDFDLTLTGFGEGELADLMADKTAGLTDPDEVPPVPEQPVTVTGDVWRLGKHSIWCGSSSTDEAAKFFGRRDLVLTDPPYCSGGFKESDRFIGSVGTAGQHKQIASDRLSTRGYQSLMRSAIFSIDAPFFYAFTDWRMWSTLFDISEAAGAGVRSMVVWNKQRPGMGLGWRPQHEIILWSARIKPKFPAKFGGVGNVISLARQPNILHTTQKPVELLEKLLDGAPWVETVADPFLGSGSTLIACEKRGISCKGAELDAAYVDTAVERWMGFTGEDAILEATGQTFSDVKAERSPEAKVA